MSLLEELGNTFLKFPDGLIDYAYRNIYDKKGYIVTLEFFCGKLLRRAFAFKKTGDYSIIKFQEVCRRLENEKYVLLCNIENHSMAGNIVTYSDSECWRPKTKDDPYGWYLGNKNNWWFVGAYEFYNTDDMIKQLNIPYCGYNADKYTDKIDFFRYYEIYTKNPKIELLAKSGWGHLITSTRYFNFKGKNFEQIFKIPSYWKQYMVELSIQDIFLIRKNKIKSKEDLDSWRYVYSLDNYFKYIKKYFTPKMIKYLNNLDGRKTIYNDYLRLAEENGYPMNENRYLYPENLNEAHDLALSEHEFIQNRQYEEGFKKGAERFKKYNYHNNQYSIQIAETPESLVQESLEMKNCVRTYISDVASNKTHIFFLRKIDDLDHSFVTVELKNKKVTQAYAFGNSSINDSTRNFLKCWCRKFNFNASLLAQ